jgi:hypothetical protein
MTKEFHVEQVQETHDTFTWDVRDRGDVFVASFPTKCEAQQFIKAEIRKRQIAHNNHVHRQWQCMEAI